MFIKRIDRYGELIINKVCDYLDRPVLFLCTSKTVEKTFGDYVLLVLLVDEDAQSETFLIGYATPQTIKQLEDNRFDIKQFFLKEAWLVDICTFYYNTDKFTLKTVFDITEKLKNLLPEDGIYLNV